MSYNNYKIRKLDKRYKFNNHFKYAITFDKTQLAGILQFEKVKEWFANHYGYSANASHWQMLHDSYHKRKVFFQDEQLDQLVNPKWSWSADSTETNLKIYVQASEELTFFKLSFKES